MRDALNALVCYVFLRSTETVYESSRITPDTIAFSVVILSYGHIIYITAGTNQKFRNAATDDKHFPIAVV